MGDLPDVRVRVIAFGAALCRSLAPDGQAEGATMAMGLFRGTDEVRLFEKLCLEGFQAGLSWLTILRKRDNFRAAFAGFEPAVVAGFDEQDVARLLADTGIVRHRGKIEATVAGARALTGMHERGETLAALVQQHSPHREPGLDPQAAVPTTCPEAVALSKELKRRGFRYVGPTTTYAFMQAMGLVNDHVRGCEFLSTGRG